LQIAFQCFHPRFGGTDFFLRKFLHVRIRQQFLRRPDIAGSLRVRAVERHQRTEFGVLARHLAVAVHVGGRIFLRQQTIQFFQSFGELVEFGEH